MQAEYESEAVAELRNVAASSTESPTTDEKEEAVPGQPVVTVLKDEEQVSTGNSPSEETSAPACLACLTCLTVQPNRVLCGVRLRNCFFLKKSNCFQGNTKCNMCGI